MIAGMWLGSDELDGPVVLPQAVPGARDRAARAQTADEDINVGAGGQDFHRRRLVMAAGIFFGTELVQEESAPVISNPAGGVNGAFDPEIAGHPLDLGAIGLQSGDNIGDDGLRNDNPPCRQRSGP